MWWFRGLHANLHRAPGGSAGSAGARRAGRCSTPAAAPADSWRGLRRPAPDARALRPRARRGRVRARRARRAAPGLRRQRRRAALSPTHRSTRSSAPTCCAIAASTSGAALAEFRRCLRPGGILVLNLPAYRWLYSAHDVAVDNVRRYRARRGAWRCSRRPASPTCARAIGTACSFRSWCCGVSSAPPGRFGGERRGAAAGAGRAPVSRPASRSSAGLRRARRAVARSAARSWRSR